MYYRNKMVQNFWFQSFSYFGIADKRQGTFTTFRVEGEGYCLEGSNEFRCI
jgi:hypothetical protein